MYTSHSSGILLLQSANFPGNVVDSRPFFLLAVSLAFLAASLALEAEIHLSIINFATFGFSSKYSANVSFFND